MRTLYYTEVKSDKKNLPELIALLKSFGLKTDCIEEHYKEHMVIGGEMIMWCGASDYPAWVFRSQEEIIKSCGMKIEY